MALRAYQRQALWIAQEATPYTAESAGTQPLALIDAFDVQFRNNTNVGERPGGRGFGNERGVPGARAATVTFKTHAYGSTYSTLSSLLLPCASFGGATGGVYSVEGRSPEVSGSKAKTATLIVYQDGRYKTLRGAVTNGELRGVAGQKLEWTWTFTGVYEAMGDVTFPTATYPSALPIRFADATITLGTFSPVVAEFTLNLGNDVQLIEDASDASGYRGAFVANITPTLELVCEAELVGDFNAESAFRAASTFALSMEIGTSTNKIEIAAPAAQILTLNDANRGGKLYEPLSLALCRTPGGDGDDMLTITIS